MKTIFQVIADIDEDGVKINGIVLDVFDTREQALSYIERVKFVEWLSNFEIYEVGRE